ncbi:MAG: Na+/H+ antiporter subunit E [Desulfurivibrio sp.]
MILFGEHHITWRRLLRRSLELTAIWLILTGGRSDAWLPGLVVVIAAALASLLLPVTHTWSWRPGGLCRFLPFFLHRSLLAGLDVARRALAPDPALRPGLHRYRWQLPPGPARIFFANTVSLLPGTLSVGLDRETLLIHTINADRELGEDLADLERMVGLLFKQGNEP